MFPSRGWSSTISRRRRHLRHRLGRRRDRRRRLGRCRRRRGGWGVLGTRIGRPRHRERFHVDRRRRHRPTPHPSRRPSCPVDPRPRAVRRSDTSMTTGATRGGRVVPPRLERRSCSCWRSWPSWRSLRRATTARGPPSRMSLANTRATVDNALAPVRQAARLKPLRKAGRNARAQVPALDDADVDLMNTKNRDLAGPAATLVASERAFLKALGGLNRVTDRRVGETDLGTWNQVRARIGDAAQDLVAASAAVSALDLDEPSGGLGFSTAQLNRTLEPVDTMIANAHTRIERWRRDRAKYRADLEAARRLSIPTSEYRDDVLAALNDYDRDRRRSTAGRAGPRAIAASDAHRLHTEVSGFSSARDLTVDELSNALESAPRSLPQSVRRAHKAFGTRTARVARRPRQRGRCDQRVRIRPARIATTM